MVFGLGVITGIAISIFVAVVALYFKKPIQQIIEPIAKKVENAGPREKGYVFEPETEEAEARREHVEKNSAEGKDTPIKELQ